MTKTYIKQQAVTGEIDTIEYEVKAMIDGTFRLSVWVWDTEQEIIRHDTYRPSATSMKRLTSAIGTYQADEGWFFETEETVMEVTYTRRLS